MSLDAGHPRRRPDLVQELDGARVHVQLVHQVQHDAGRACWSGAHRQALDRGEAHRRRDAVAATIAHIDAPLPSARPPRPRGRDRVDGGSIARDVLVRQPVEAVTAHPRSVIDAGSANACATGHRAVERRVEARDLRQRGLAREQHADRREVVVAGAAVRAGTSVEVGESTRRRRASACRSGPPCTTRCRPRGERESRQRLTMCRIRCSIAPSWPSARYQLCSASVAPAASFATKCGAVVEAFELAALHELGLVAGQREQRELEARRSRVEDDDRVGHGQRGFIPSAAASARRSCATSIITAADASRVRTLSARDVARSAPACRARCPRRPAPAR